jgi:hypothetical protein
LDIGLRANVTAFVWLRLFRGSQYLVEARFAAIGRIFVNDPALSSFIDSRD